MPGTLPRQLLPVLGSNLLGPKPGKAATGVDQPESTLVTKGVRTTGVRTPDGFVVYEGSQAVMDLVPSSQGTGNFADRRRGELLEEGLVVVEGDHLRFTSDVEFSSPSGAAAVVRGGSANGLVLWKDAAGRTLKELESATAG